MDTIDHILTLLPNYCNYLNLIQSFISIYLGILYASPKRSRDDDEGRIVRQQEDLNVDADDG